MTVKSGQLSCRIAELVRLMQAQQLTPCNTAGGATAPHDFINCIGPLVAQIVTPKDGNLCQLPTGDPRDDWPAGCEHCLRTLGFLTFKCSL